MAYSILKDASETASGLDPLLSSGLTPSQTSELISYAEQWNANSKTFLVAQLVQKHFLLSGAFEAAKGDDRARVAKLMAYGVKHSDRLTQLNRKFAIVDAMFHS